jgi:hypothetical protein
MLCALGSAQSWWVYLGPSSDPQATILQHAVARGAIIGRILTLIHFPIVVVLTILPTLK